MPSLSLFVIITQALARLHRVLKPISADFSWLSLLITLGGISPPDDLISAGMQVIFVMIVCWFTPMIRCLNHGTVTPEEGDNSYEVSNKAIVSCVSGVPKRHLKGSAGIIKPGSPPQLIYSS